MKNISEGYERKGNRELTKFPYCFKCSAKEVSSMLSKTFIQASKVNLNNKQDSSKALKNKINYLLYTICALRFGVCAFQLYKKP
jgi:hypothetical protein